MKAYFLIVLLFFVHVSFSQNIVEVLKEFYNNSDFNYYELEIQKDLIAYDSMLINASDKSIPVSFKPANIDLSKQNKVFALAITLINTEEYNFEDDIYDFIAIDSLRTFIVVCIDEKENVIGITDTEEPGSFISIRDDFYFKKKKERKRIQNMIKNINSENPDLILYCDAFSNSFMYVKNNRIYHYNLKNACSKEFNEAIRESGDLNMVRKLNRMVLPFSKELKGNSKLFYRLTGNTPKDEVRMHKLKE